MKDETARQAPQGGEIPLRALLVYGYLCRVVEGQGRYLLLQRNGKLLRGVWQPVTGRIEANENGWETALREMAEETGLAPDRLYTANRVEIFYEPRWECIAVAPVFIGFMDSKFEPAVTLSNEHGAFQWCTAEQACALLHFPQQCDTIRYLEREFVQKTPLEYLQIEFREKA